MSHVASVKAFCTDLDSLERACEPLGLELVRGATEYKWFGQWVGDYSGDRAAVTNGHDPKTFGRCQHKIRVKGAGADTYEIGLVPRLDGEPGWELLYDNWGGGYGLEAKAGRGLEKLKDGMLTDLTITMLAADGYTVYQDIDSATGEMVITAVN